MCADTSHLMPCGYQCMHAATDYLTLHEMAWLDSKVTRKCYVNIKLHLQTEGPDRHIPKKEPCIWGNSGGQGVIPWMKLRWKIYKAINKEQRRKSSTCQLPRQTVALLTAYGPQEPIPGSPKAEASGPMKSGAQNKRKWFPNCSPAALPGNENSPSPP